MNDSFLNWIIQRPQELKILSITLDDDDDDDNVDAVRRCV
jgi:hypothetical protein